MSQRRSPSRRTLATVERAHAWVAVADGDVARAVIEALERRGYDVADEGETVADDTDALVVVDAAKLGILSGLTRAAGVALVPAGDDEAIRAALDAGADEAVAVPDELPFLGRRFAAARARRLVASGGSPRFPAANDAALLASAQRQAQELQLLHRVRSAIALDFELGAIFRVIVDQIAAAFGYTHVSVYTLDGDVLGLRHQVGYDNVLERIPIDLGVSGRVARTGESVLIADVSAEPDFLAAIPGLRSEVCVPIFLGGKVAGTLNIESAGDWTLTHHDLRLMQEVSGFLGLAVERSALLSTLRGSEQRLRLALEAAGMGTWLWRPQTGEVIWSEQMGPLYGKPPGTQGLTSEEWFELIHPADREQVRRNDRQILQFGSDYETEFRVVLPSGAIRWLEGKGRVVERNEAGEPTTLVGVTRDITGRKRLEEERLRLVQLEAERAKAEEAQRRITDTLERLTAGFVAIDGSWRLTYLNQRAQAMLGHAGASLIGRTLWEAFPQLAGSDVEAALREAAASQAAAQFDARWPGVGRWFEAHVYSAEDGLSIYLQDATERRRMEEEKRQTEARFRSLVQHASDVIVIIDRQGIVRYASPAIERVIGVTAEEIVGFDNFFRVHPHDAKRLRRAFVRVAKTPGVSPPIVLRFRHRSGAYRWLEVTATNLFDDPAIEGIVANCRDVTERHDAEHNLWFLAETSAMLGTSLDLGTTLASISRLVVMDLADMCIVDVVDEQGQSEAYTVAHRDADSERRLGQFRAAWPLQRSAPYGPGYVHQTGESLLYATIDDEIGQLWLTGTDDGREAPDFGFRSAIIVPLIARGATVGVLTVASRTPGRFTAVELGLVEELARRAAMAVDNARLYRAARAAVEARDQFLSVAAHELRTPITAITGFASLLEREVRQRNDPDRVVRFVRRLTDAGSRLALLVEDMLDVSRIRLGQLPLRIAPVDLAALLERVRLRYEEQDGAAGHVLTLRTPSGECVVPADEDRLDQVISNVLDNAVKYSEEGSEVTIALVGDDDGCLLTVRDRGIGLPPGDLESIFRPFGRAANAVASNVPGLGIGLFICRNIIERHGGRIWAESDGEGTGTTIAIWLPTSGAPDVAEPAGLFDI